MTKNAILILTRSALPFAETPEMQVETG